MKEEELRKQLEELRLQQERFQQAEAQRKVRLSAKYELLYVASAGVSFNKLPSLCQSQTCKAIEQRYYTSL